MLSYGRPAVGRKKADEQRLFDPETCDFPEWAEWLVDGVFYGSTLRAALACDFLTTEAFELCYSDECERRGKDLVTLAGHEVRSRHGAR